MSHAPGKGSRPQRPRGSDDGGGHRSVRSKTRLRLLRWRILPRGRARASPRGACSSRLSCTIVWDAPLAGRKETRMPRLPDPARIIRQKYVLAAAQCLVGATLVIAVLAPWQTTAQTLEGNILPVKAVHNYCKDNCALGQFEALSPQTVHYLHDPL